MRADFVRALTKHWVFSFLPALEIQGYRKVTETEDGAIWRRFDGMTVIASGAAEADGRKWIHVSCAHPKRLPSWKDMMEVKDIFVGTDRTAIQVFPPKAEHVNIHPNCLHLWSCIDEQILPDFTRGTGSI